MRSRCAISPCESGNDPVPIVACVCAVEVGVVPTVARSYHVPSGIRDARCGQSPSQRSRTLRPPASQTIVMTSRGGSSLPWIASTIGVPSLGRNGKPCSSPVVGAIPAGGAPAAVGGHFAISNTTGTYGANGIMAGARSP